MTRAFRWAAGLLLICGLNGPALAEVAVRLPAAVAATADLAGMRVIDYDSYLWVIGPEADRLPGAEPFAGAGEVRLPGVRFDPLRDGEPPLPAGVLPDSGERGLRLVQLVGPPKSAWVDGWAERGLEIVAYFPHFTYLVRAERAAVEAVAGEGYVRWHGRFEPPYAVDGPFRARSTAGDRIALLLDTGGEPEGLAAANARLAALGAGVERVARAAADGRQWLLQLVAPVTRADAIAAVPGAIWVGEGSAGIRLEDEMSDQIVAGNHPGGTPVLGYRPHLAALGFDGTGVIWTIADTGVDWDHPDLASRLVGGLTPPGAACDIPGQPGSDCAGGGHGTHVAGIVGGDATAGFTDAAGFLYGLGVAPAVSLFAINVFSDIEFEEITEAALAAGSIGANNSWASGGAGVGYTAAARIQDLLVRDGDLGTTTVAEPFIQVFSAGNSGPGASTITEPKEAKNVISVANSLNKRAGSIDAIATGSSRGPARDGRILPTVAAPGSTIASTRNDLGGNCAVPIGGTNGHYAFCSGTSMAAPHVSGLLAVASEWWRARTGGDDFSPAMAKALLVASAVDMGVADVPNNQEGWGRVQLTRLMAPGVSAAYLDQTHRFGESGEAWNWYCDVDVPGEPLRVVLAWSDAAGAAGANPALVNDLDLTVSHGPTSWLGNVLSGGWSVSGGSADRLANLESVFVQSPTAGPVAITVAAPVIAGDGVPYNGDPTDQDFALVCINCRQCDSGGFFSDGFESGSTSAWAAVFP